MPIVIDPYRFVTTSSSPAEDATFVDEASDSTGVAFKSFAGVNLGAAAATRRIFASVSWYRGDASAVNLSSATIGGVTATIHAQRTTLYGVGATGADVRHGLALISATVPTGTTGTINLAFDAVCFAAVQVLRSGFTQDLTPDATGSYYLANNSASTVSLNINTTANGLLVAAGLARYVTSVAATGFTLKRSGVVPYGAYSGVGTHLTATAETPRALAFTNATGLGGCSIIVAAAFR